MNTTLARLRRPAMWLTLAMIAVAVVAMLALVGALHAVITPDFTLTVNDETVHMEGIDAASVPAVLAALCVLLCAGVLLLPLGLLLLMVLLSVVFAAVALGVLLPLAFVLLPLLVLLGLPLLAAFMLGRWLWRRSARSSRPPSTSAPRTTIDP